MLTMAQLSDKLRRLLKHRIHAAELTQVELARHAGITQAHASNFLAGKRGLSLAATDRIQRALRIDVRDLVMVDADPAAQVEIGFPNRKRRKRPKRKKSAVTLP